jgi:hypothetical protein
MKKTILLFCAAITAIATNGQQAYQGSSSPQNVPTVRILQQDNHLLMDKKDAYNYPLQNNNNTQAPGTGAKTTLPSGRWYDYVNFMLRPYEQNVFPGQDLNYYSPSMWNDTSAIYGYTGTSTPYFSFGEVNYNTLVSFGASVDPYWYRWNACDSLTSVYPYFSGVFAARTSDALTLDSLFIPGWYTGAPAKTSVVDTLIVTIVYGNGNPTSDMPHNTLTGSVLSYYCTSCTALDFLDLYRDTVNNRGAHLNSVPTTNVFKFTLNSSDTNANAYKNAVFPRPGHVPADVFPPMTIPADNVTAMTVTYKSGDAAYPAFPAHDTVRKSDGTTITSVKYNYWQAQEFYVAASSTSTTPLWNWYNWNDGNRGDSYFAFGAHGWGAPDAKYTPNWNIITGTSTAPAPADAQEMHVGFHFTCSTCPLVCTPSLTVNNVEPAFAVKVMPNPADNELLISCTGAKNATVSLTNMIGQVIATQTVSNGTTIFNTAALPSGIYVYNLRSENGETATGRVVIAH